MSGALRWPRLRVLADGAPLAGAFEADVASNNHFAADRFLVGLAVGADPFALLEIVDRPEIEIEVLVSLDDGAGFESLVKGDVDRVEYDPMTGVVRLEGRDFSSRLMEARVGESFVNLTASEIATKMAARHGLDADVQVTRVPVGRLWEGNHQRSLLDQFSRAATEWDLLAALAEIEGFDLFVEGPTLHFRPTGHAPLLRLSLAETGSVRLERALTLAGGIEVVVRSWNAERQESCEERVSRPGQKLRQYVYVVPNLTAAEAALLAQRRLAAIGRHERVVSIEMPGELDIRPRMRIALAGSGTGFDQPYWVDRVDRRIGRHGFRQTVHARNGNGATGAGSEGEVGAWSDS
ncbi:MAG: hypothetical protein NT133_15400 [Alphaproteobacteria bacterium]|nr:hypothetical protein [Alphaproteobacteria bacterium]